MWHARTPSAVHYANRLFAHQSHYADRPTTNDRHEASRGLFATAVLLVFTVVLFKYTCQIHMLFEIELIKH